MNELAAVSKPADASGLARLRAELDRIDDGLHDLIMARAALVQQVAALKSAAGAGGSLRPGREAAIIRRLVARHHGVLAPSVIVQVWRELLAGAVAVQAPFAVGVSEAAGAAAAREQFGALTPLQHYPSEDAALGAVRDARVSVAVLPLDADSPWWRQLDTPGEPRLYIVARLPFWRQRHEDRSRVDALVVGSAPPDPSGDDRTVVLLEPGAPASMMHEVLGTADGWQLVARDGGSTDADVRRSDGRVLGAYACPIEPVA